MSVTGITIRLNISKDTENLNSTINQLDLIDIHRLHLTTAEHTFFFQVHMEYLPKIHHILHHKTNLNQFARTEIIQSVYSDYK